MEKIQLQSWNCPICFDQFKNPMIHKECGQTMDQKCILESTKRFGRCPICNVEATMEQFRPNVALRDAIEELQSVALVAKNKEKVSTPSLPLPSFGPSVLANEKKSFSHALNSIKKKDHALYDAHVKKESTRKMSIDSRNGYVAVFKSRNWHFYKIGNGAGPELCKKKMFKEGVALIFSKQR